MVMQSIIKPPALRMLLAALLVVVLTGCGYLYLSAVGQDARAAGHGVSIRDSRFSPKRIDVAKNDSVTWHWRSDLEHNVTFTRVPQGASRRGSGTQTDGPPFTKRMSKRGTYHYECTIHGFTGRVVVH